MNHHIIELAKIEKAAADEVVQTLNAVNEATDKHSQAMSRWVNARVDLEKASMELAMQNAATIGGKQ